LNYLSHEQYSALCRRNGHLAGGVLKAVGHSISRFSTSIIAGVKQGLILVRGSFAGSMEYQALILVNLCIYWKHDFDIIELPRADQGTYQRLMSASWQASREHSVTINANIRSGPLFCAFQYKQSDVCRSLIYIFD